MFVSIANHRLGRIVIMEEGRNIFNQEWKVVVFEDRKGVVQTHLYLQLPPEKVEKHNTEYNIDETDHINTVEFRLIASSFEVVGWKRYRAQMFGMGSIKIRTVISWDTQRGCIDVKDQQPEQQEYYHHFYKSEVHHYAYWKLILLSSFFFCF